jgi:hypothetical protein
MVTTADFEKDAKFVNPLTFTGILMPPVCVVHAGVGVGVRVGVRVGVGVGVGVGGHGNTLTGRIGVENVAHSPHGYVVISQ